MKTTGYAILLVTLLSACATSPTGRRQLMLVSENEAITASRQQYLQTVSKLSADGKLITDQNSGAGRHHHGTPYQSGDPDATRLPDLGMECGGHQRSQRGECLVHGGGRMALFTGLFGENLPTDDELAQVMGHEISHALANHTAERMSVAMVSQLGALAIGIAADSAAGMAGAQAAAALAVTLPNSRASESEADRIGIELAARAGYDPDQPPPSGQKWPRSVAVVLPSFSAPILRREQANQPRSAGQPDDALLHPTGRAARLSTGAYPLAGQGEKARKGHLPSTTGT